MERPLLVLHQWLCYLADSVDHLFQALLTTNGDASMTNRRTTATLPEMAKWVGALMMLAAAVWTPGVIFLTGAWVIYGKSVVNGLGLATQEDIARIEFRIEDAASSLQGLTREITILSRPEDVVNYRDLPVPAGGFCQVGKNCVLTVFAQRDPAAAECRVTSAEMVIISQGREYVALPDPTRQPINLGPAPRAVEPTFQLPLTISTGPARAIIRTHYNSCPWQIDGQPPVTQDSPSFPLEIRS
jgi:hypothetical protein